VIAAQVALKTYGEQVQYSKYLTGLVQFAMVVYFFKMLVAWQQTIEDASQS